MFTVLLPRLQQFIAASQTKTPPLKLLCLSRPTRLSIS